MHASFAGISNGDTGNRHEIAYHAISNTSAYSSFPVNLKKRERGPKSRKQGARSGERGDVLFVPYFNSPSCRSSANTRASVLLRKYCAGIRGISQSSTIQ